MEVLACLGRANYWMTIPFLVIVSLVGLVMVAVPRRIPGRYQDRPWITRTIGLAAIVLVWAVFIPRAVHEARTDPNCEMDSAPAP